MFCGSYENEFISLPLGTYRYAPFNMHPLRGTSPLSEGNKDIPVWVRLLYAHPGPAW